MAKIDKTILKSKFETGDIPTESDFIDFIDSTYNVNDGDGTQFLANDGNYKSIDTTTYVDAGVLIKPSFTDNANGSITLGTGTYVLYNSTETFPPQKYIVEGNSFVLVDQTINYITINYNNGTPIVESSTSRSNINQLTVIPLYTIYRNGVNLVYLDWDHQSVGLANKLSDRLVRTRRYEAEPGGLVLGEVATRIVTITAGAVWSGGNKYPIDSYRSDTDTFIFHYHENGSWTKTTNTTTYNNLQYDDGTNLQTLSNNSYGVVWIVKRIGTPSNNACMILGNQSYNLTNALTSKVPPLPPELNSLGVLVGRIIVQKGSNTAYQIDSIFETQFGVTSINDHTNLSNLQGGVDGEYYHLTLEEYEQLDLLSVISDEGDGTKYLSDDGTYKEVSGSSDTYTNATPVPTTIGGISSGTTFNNKTMSEMWTNLLYPYQSPTFSAFSFGQSSPIEVGTTLTGSKTFTWSTTNSSNISTNSLSILDVTGSSTLASGIANDGTESLNIGIIQKTSATSHTWRISGVNTNSVTFTRDVTIAWQWRRFFGESTNTSLIENEIESLRVNALATGFAGTYSFLGGGYKYLCYPTAFGTASTFKDQSTNLDVPFESPVVVNVTNSLGIATDYRVHRSTNILGAAINIVVS